MRSYQSRIIARDQAKKWAGTKAKPNIDSATGSK